MPKKALRGAKKPQQAIVPARPIEGELVTSENEQVITYERYQHALKGCTNDRHRTFVEEYLVDLNATRAYAEAYKCNQECARASGARLLANVNVAAAIEAGRAWKTALVRIRQYEVIDEYRKIAFANQDDYAAWGDHGVRLVRSEDLTRAQKAAIQEIREFSQEHYDKEGNVIGVTRQLRLKLHDKRAALRDIGQHLGMFPTGAAGNVAGDVTPVQFNFIINVPEGPPGGNR